MTENLKVDTHWIMEGTIKLYLKLKKKGRTHRVVLQRSKGDVLGIEIVMSIERDGALFETNAKLELINKLLKELIVPETINL